MTTQSDLRAILKSLADMRAAGITRLQVGDIIIEFGNPGEVQVSSSQDKAIDAMRKDLRVTGYDPKKHCIPGDNHTHTVIDPTLDPYTGYIYDSAQQLHNATSNDKLTTETISDTLETDETLTASDDSPDEEEREQVNLDFVHLD